MQTEVEIAMKVQTLTALTFLSLFIEVYYKMLRPVHMVKDTTPSHTSSRLGLVAVKGRIKPIQSLLATHGRKPCMPCHAIPCHPRSIPLGALALSQTFPCAFLSPASPESPATPISLLARGRPPHRGKVGVCHGFVCRYPLRVVIPQHLVLKAGKGG